jgi:hypothetical protein
MGTTPARGRDRVALLPFGWLTSYLVRLLDGSRGILTVLRAVAEICVVDRRRRQLTIFCSKP